jgi:hypothetical protein
MDASRTSLANSGGRNQGNQGNQNKISTEFRLHGGQQATHPPKCQHTPSISPTFAHRPVYYPIRNAAARRPTSSPSCLRQPLCAAPLLPQLLLPTRDRALHCALAPAASGSAPSGVGSRLRRCRDGCTTLPGKGSGAGGKKPFPPVEIGFDHCRALIGSQFIVSVCGRWGVKIRIRYPLAPQHAGSFIPDVIFRLAFRLLSPSFLRTAHVSKWLRLERA